jgi:hypothetical protein
MAMAPKKARTTGYASPFLGHPVALVAGVFTGRVRFRSSNKGQGQRSPGRGGVALAADERDTGPRLRAIRFGAALDIWRCGSRAAGPCPAARTAGAQPAWGRGGGGSWRRSARRGGGWRSQPGSQGRIGAGQNSFSLLTGGRPQQDSNLRTRLRRPLLYPLSYGGSDAPGRLLQRAGARLPVVKHPGTRH